MKRLILVLSTLFFVCTACNGQPAANDNAVKSPTTIDDSQSPLNNPLVPPQEKGCGPSGCEKPPSYQVSGMTLALAEIQGLLDNGTCKIRFRYLANTAFIDGFYHELPKFTVPTGKCPVPDVQPEIPTPAEAYKADPCTQNTIQSMNPNGTISAIVIVQPDSCLAPTTTQRQGKVDNMCLPYGTSTTRPGQTC
jgi:hypothetical protein